MPDLEIEKKLFARNYDLLGGVDEAGRGPLAGPVVAACVLLTKENKKVASLLGRINDSKKLSAKKRKNLNQEIFACFDNVGVGISSHETIDRINVLEATFLAMKKAITKCGRKANYYLVDGSLKIKNFSLAQQAIKKGDNKSLLIAAASIVAKVKRDEIMQKYHDDYPVYGFDRHKGYGTKQHLIVLKKYGPSSIHRRSFAPLRKSLKK